MSSISMTPEAFTRFVVDNTHAPRESLDASYFRAVQLSPGTIRTGRADMLRSHDAHRR